MPHSPFPWTLHPHTPTAVFDADGKRIVDQWVAPDGWLPIDTAPKDATQVLVCREFPEHQQVGIDLLKEDLWWRSSVYNQPTHWMPLPAPPSDKPAPAPLDPETAAANAALIAAIPRMVEALDGMVLVCGRTGDSLEDFEEQAEVFRRETGFMRPGKDMPLGGGEDDCDVRRRAKYIEWVRSKLAAGRAVLASIGRVK